MADTANAVVLDALDAGYGAMSPGLSPDEKTLHLCNRFDHEIQDPRRLVSATSHFEARTNLFRQSDMKNLRRFCEQDAQEAQLLKDNDMARRFDTAVIVVTHDEKIMPTFRRIYQIRDGRTHEQAGQAVAADF